MQAESLRLPHPSSEEFFLATLPAEENECAGRTEMISRGERAADRPTDGATVRPKKYKYASGLALPPSLAGPAGEGEACQLFGRHHNNNSESEKLI